MHHVLNDQDVKQWFSAAVKEPYVIEAAEVGKVRN